MPRGRKTTPAPKTLGARLTLDFLQREKMTQILFAETCNMGRSTLNEYLRGTKHPSLEDAFRIQTLTHREVPAHSWLLPLEPGCHEKKIRPGKQERAGQTKDVGADP